MAHIEQTKLITQDEIRVIGKFHEVVVQKGTGKILCSCSRMKCSHIAWVVKKYMTQK